jgi:hypothetical protein
MQRHMTLHVTNVERKRPNVEEKNHSVKIVSGYP